MNDTHELCGPVCRLYHIVSINERTGAKTYMTRYAMPHGPACVNLSKFTVHSFRRLQLEEVSA
jgi:hypothetical protein